MTNISIQQKTENGYENLLPQTSSKNSIVSEEICNLFNITGGTVEQVLQILGVYNQYWWKKEDCSFSTSQSSEEIHNVFSTDSATIYYGDSLSLTQNGRLTVSPLKSYSGTRNSVINYAKQNLIGKYCNYDNGSIWNLATGFYSSYTVNLYIQGKQYKLKNISLSNPIYLTSTSQTEYTEGYLEGSFYTGLGKPFKKIPQSIKYEKTFYVGTGIYDDSTLSINFSFSPMLVVVGSYEVSSFLIFGQQGGLGATYQGASTATYVPRYFLGNTLTITLRSLGSTNKINQLNTSYFCFALG